MDSKNTLADFVEWDVRNWAVALDFWKTHSSQGLSGRSVLEVGCGYGGLTLWLVSQGAKVVCSDVNGPLERAVNKHRAKGISHLVQYQAIDATNIPYTEQFDVVLFKSILGGIGQPHPGSKELQAKAILEMHKALKKGGELFFAENLTASPLHKFLRRRFIKWGNTWRYPTLEEMQEFLSPFSEINYTTIGFAGTFGRTERQRNILGRADRMLIDRVVPVKWKYIIAGVARK
jgi:SAM-dependent methyltransferase